MRERGATNEAQVRSYSFSWHVKLYQLVRIILFLLPDTCNLASHHIWQLKTSALRSSLGIAGEQPSPMKEESCEAFKDELKGLQRFEPADLDSPPMSPAHDSEPLSFGN